MNVIEREVKIVNRLGMHARAAGHFRRTAAGFKANIDVIREGMTANAKSLLGLMALEAAQGTKIVIRAKGDDAEAAVAALAALVAGRFGENE
ncbi:MAG TPA: HPr family phosphocarrier protein [bacterium]|nr:HPr family phosphocarrier protein [bacterium]